MNFQREWSDSRYHHHCWVGITGIAKVVSVVVVLVPQNRHQLWLHRLNLQHHFKMSYQTIITTTSTNYHYHHRHYHLNHQNYHHYYPTNNHSHHHYDSYYPTNKLSSPRPLVLPKHYCPKYPPPNSPPNYKVPYTKVSNGYGGGD